MAGLGPTRTRFPSCSPGCGGFTVRLTRTLTCLAELKQDSNAFPVVANIEKKQHVK
jgi:hypothetical protein